MASDPISLRILVVEDDALIADYLSDALTELGCTVIGPAASGAEAIQSVEGAGQVDCALVDLRLRGAEDGVAVALALRQRFDVPAMILSGAIDADIRRRAAPAAPLGFLQKPVLLSQLEKALREVIKPT